MIVGGKVNIPEDTGFKKLFDKNIKENDMQGLTDQVKTAISVHCHYDPEFLSKFRAQVDAHTAQIIAALPHVAEQALMQELWNVFESGVFMHDNMSEGDFDSYLDNILSWLGDHSASKKSDLSFLIQKVFPFCVAWDIPIKPIIANISKSRTAVPVLRDLYDKFEKKQVTPETLHDKYLQLIEKIGNKDITNIEFTGWLKESGLKGSYFSPMPAFDWASAGNQGSIIVSYNSLADRQRIINKLGNIVKSIEYNPTEMTTAHYGVWAGTVIQILMTYGKGMLLSPTWDGKTDTKLALYDPTNGAHVVALGNVKQALLQSTIKSHTISDSLAHSGILHVEWPEAGDPDLKGWEIGDPDDFDFS